MKHSEPEPPPCMQVIGTMELKHITHGCYLLSFKNVTFQNFLSRRPNWISILQYYFPRSSYPKNKHSRDMSGMLYFAAVIKHYVFPLESQPYSSIQRNSEVTEDWQKQSQDHRITRVHRESRSHFLLNDSNLRKESKHTESYVTKD